jgi:hypothetical protein
MTSFSGASLSGSRDRAQFPYSTNWRIGLQANEEKAKLAKERPAA